MYRVAMEYRHILCSSLALHLEYVCIPLHSYPRKRNKNAVQSLYLHFQPLLLAVLIV